MTVQDCCRLSATCKFIRQVVSDYYEHLCEKHKLEYHVRRHFDYYHFKNANDAIDYKMYRIFISSRYSYAWLYNYGMKRKNKLKQSVYIVTKFSGMVTPSIVKDKYLQRDVIKVRFYQGFGTCARLYDVPPGHYDFTVRVKCPNKAQVDAFVPCDRLNRMRNIFIRINLEWEEPYKAYYKKNFPGQPYPSNISLDQIHKQGKFLNVSVQEWKEMVLEEGDNWFDLKIRDVDLSATVDVEWEMHGYEYTARDGKGSMNNALLIDYIQFEEVPDKFKVLNEKYANHPAMLSS